MQVAIAMVVAVVVLVGLSFLFRESLGGRIIVLVILALLYFIPAVIAAQRDIPNKNSVFIINLFLGWTLIGWVIALAMAVGQAETKKPELGKLDFSSEEPRPKVDDIRQCPFCAEDIKKAAVVCKHCGRDVEPIAN